MYKCVQFSHHILTSSNQPCCSIAEICEVFYFVNHFLVDYVFFKAECRVHTAKKRRWSDLVGRTGCRCAHARRGVPPQVRASVAQVGTDWVWHQSDCSTHFPYLVIASGVDCIWAP